MLDDSLEILSAQRAGEQFLKFVGTLDKLGRKIARPREASSAKDIPVDPALQILNP